MDLSDGQSLRLGYDCFVRPRAGESVGGDAACMHALDHFLLVAIVDVLGHGPEAHALTHVIEAYLSRHQVSDVKALMSGLHKELAGSRGTALGLSAVHPAERRLDYVGVGNTVIRRFGKSETRLVSQDGVLGQNTRSLKVHSMQLEPGDTIVLYTDGVSDRFTLDDYPALLNHSPDEVAGNIVKRFGKQHDDAACIAVRCIT